MLGPLANVWCAPSGETGRLRAGTRCEARRASQLLRTFANILDIVANDPDQDPFKLLGFEPRDLKPEESAVMEGRQLEAANDDEYGGSSVDT